MLSSYSRMLMVSRAQVLSASRPDFRDIITRQASGVPGIKTTDILEWCEPPPPTNNADQTLHDKRATEQPRSVLIFKLKAEINSGTIMTSRKGASFSSGDNKLHKNAREREKVGIAEAV